MGFERAIFFGCGRPWRANLEQERRLHAQGWFSYIDRGDGNGRFRGAWTRLRRCAGAGRRRKSNRMWQVVGS